jgi:hypothetical protein
MIRSRTSSIVCLSAGLLFVPAPQPALADSGGACLTAARANESLRSYRAVMVTGFDGKNQTSTVDIVKPDRFHVVEPEIEMIAVGFHAWQRTGGGSWKPMPGLDGKDIFAASSVKFKPGAASCVDAGMGLWHGQPAHIYKATSLRAGKSSQTTLYVFGDGLVHHMDIATSSGNVTMDFSAFNSATVNAPR